MLTNFYSHALELLGIIRFIKYNFSCLDSVDVLYIVLIRSKPEYTSVIWKNLTDLINWKIHEEGRKFKLQSIYSVNFSSHNFIQF
jgi:hypothetical protein